MGNTSSSLQDINEHNTIISNTSTSNNDNDHSNKGFTHSDSLPTLPTKPYVINKHKLKTTEESPFVGSPLTQAYELPNQLSKAHSGSSEDDANNSEIGVRRHRMTAENPNSGLDPNQTQPELFPSSLNEATLRRASNPDSGSEVKRERERIPFNGVPTLITWNGPARNVYVTGTFNGWKHKIPLKKCANEFSTVIHFSPGMHHLKFVVDDEWKCSSELLTATDQDGNLVNYIEVDETIISLDHPSSNQELIPSSPPGEYTTQIPAFNQSTRPKDPTVRPPALPPHLEKVLLNATLPEPVSGTHGIDEQGALPVPNHVVLNHLYACSIRDGVMAVAGTTRYYKKYVTTIYYKPVVI